MGRSATNERYATDENARHTQASPSVRGPSGTLKVSNLRLLLFSLALLSVFRPPVAIAHHEAIFGPQSSLVFSEPGYLSTQLFSRSIGAPGDKIQETTGVVSGGYSPFADVPRSFNFIQPFSYIKNFDQRTSQTGFG